MGLDPNENLFIKDRKWDAKYAPVILQRGPFQIGIPEKGEPIIKIDMESPRVDAAGGQLLFEPNGGLSPYLVHISKVLNKIHLGLEMNAQFFKELSEASLLEAVSLDLKLDDSTTYKIPELYSIDEAAFQALTGEVLERFHASGLLVLCQYVLTSRKNISQLIDRKIAKSNSDG